MAFGGGPLNNFVLQALARMAHVLRRDAGTTGMVNAVSGVLTMQGVSLWSSEPSQTGFHYDDVSDEAAHETPRVEVVPDAERAARVASYTVLHSGAAPEAVLRCDLPDGRRTLRKQRRRGPGRHRGAAGALRPRGEARRRRGDPGRA